MKIYAILPLVLFAASSSFAGFQNLTCKNESNTVLIEGLAMGFDADIKIHYSKDGKAEVYSGIVSMKPSYSDKVDANTLFAFPTGKTKLISAECKQMHVVQADGSECYGRESWQILKEREYLLTTSTGEPLFTEQRLGKNATTPGKTDDGYIQTQLLCTDEGVTSPGGCFAEQDSKVVEWVDMECQE